MKYITLIICTVWTIAAIGQSKNATKYLDELSKKYDSYETIAIDFLLTIEYPERPIETQKASIVQQGQKFVFNSDDQDIYGDGKDVWLYLKSRNEVQINNYDEDTELGLLTPRDLLKQYKTDKFKYDLIHEDDDNAYIEFVPTDRENEYSKFRLHITKRNNEIAVVDAFGKDGSTYKVEISDQQVNNTYSPTFFQFKTSDHKGVIVEDLRID